MARDRDERPGKESRYWGGGQFVALPQRFLESETLRSLTHSELRVFMYMLGKIKPGRRMDTQNGNIIATEAGLSEAFGMKVETARKAIHGLIDKGLIFRTRVGGMNGGGKQAALYLITLFMPSPKVKAKLADLNLPTNSPLNTWLKNEPVPPIPSLQSSKD